MKIVAMIQARMTSTRFPGKVLKTIAGKPMLWYVVNRVRTAKKIGDVVVATSTDPSDDFIEDYCKSNKIKYFRGDLDNVLKRYYETAKKFNADAIVRITSDCPLIDGKLIDEGIKEFMRSDCDYLSNTVKRTFPRGFDFEIFTFDALNAAFKNATKEPEREHVTPYIWRNHPEDFKIKYFKREIDKSHFRITVDTPEDFELVKILVEKYRTDIKSADDIIEILDDHPEISQLNAHIEQKHYGQ